ncbi:MAG: hypothetical protein QGG90_05890, partial [Nitrospinota bacterium]|nr:hypothetical protein [Nitrospinota bacterium]
MGKRVKDWKDRVAAVDASLLALLEKRAAILRTVSAEKLPRDLNQLGQRALTNHRGVFPVRAARRVFEEIDRGAASIVAERLVAFLGPEGTFTHQ